MLKVYRYTLSGSLSFKENFIAEVVTSFVIDSINNLFFLQTSLMQVLNGIRSGPPVCCNILDWSQVSDVEDEELISSVRGYVEKKKHGVQQIYIHVEKIAGYAIGGPPDNLDN